MMRIPVHNTACHMAVVDCPISVIFLIGAAGSFDNRGISVDNVVALYLLRMCT